MTKQPQGFRALIPHRRWVNWRYENRKGRKIKPPLTIGGQGYASATDPDTWGTHAAALRAARQNDALGIGFMLGGGFVGIDLDDCIDTETGELAKWAQDIVDQCDTYTEVSPSGTGLKLFGRSTRLPDGTGRRRGGIEVYHADRYFTVTKNAWNDRPVRDIAEAYNALHQRLGERERAQDDALSDKQIIAKVKRKHPDLWQGDTSKFDGDMSRADLALANTLAFLCGQDVDRMDRLFRRSGLMRPKWDSKRGDSTYGQRTLEKAASGAGEVLAERGEATGLRVRCMADVEPEQVRWLWDQRFALGKLSLIAGHPGIGKSFVTCYMAAQVTTGRPWHTDPDKGQPVGSVIMLSAEDDPGDTLRPRLDAAGADVRRVHQVESATVGDKRDRMVSLAHDLELLDDLIVRTPDCRLLTIDPINAYLSGVKDSHRDVDLREVLGPLQRLAAKHGIAIVVVSHLSKGGKSASGDPLQRVIGSIGYVASARSVFGVMKDPEDPLHRLMLPLKNNNAPDHGTGMGYRIGESADGLVLQWDTEAVDTDALDVFERSNSLDRAPKQREALDWLEDQLKRNGPMWTVTLLDEAKKEHVCWRTVMRALKKGGEGFVNERHPETNKYYFRLADQEGEPEAIK